MAPLLQVENLTIGFPRAEPVRSLSFEVGAGETLAIVGESGSGKSLTALALMQLLPRAAKVTSGRIVFTNTHDVRYGPGYVRWLHVQWQKDGKRVIVWPKDKADGDLIKPDWIK